MEITWVHSLNVQFSTAAIYFHAVFNYRGNGLFSAIKWQCLPTQWRKGLTTQQMFLSHT